MATTDVLTLSEARKALRIPDSVSTHDADLLDSYIPAVTTMVEDIVGPVVIRQFATTHHGGSPSVVLAGKRVVSVTSVVENGTTLTGTDYVLSSGILYRGSQTYLQNFTDGLNTVVVTYTAGIAATTATVPANIKLAARLILAHLWQSDQQGFRPEFGSPDESSEQTPAGFAIPRRAYALLEPYAASSLLGFA